MKIDGYELKPCPFCGNETLRINQEEWQPYFVVVCMSIDCNATGPLDLGQSGAIERWNERAGAVEER